MIFKTCTVITRATYLHKVFRKNKLNLSVTRVRILVQAIFCQLQLEH